MPSRGETADPTTRGPARGSAARQGGSPTALAAVPTAVGVLALSLALGACAAGLSTVWVGQPAAHRFTAVGFLVATVAFACSDAPVVHVEVGRHTFTASLSEACLAFGLLMDAPADVFLGRIAGGAVVLVLSRGRPVKAAFNVCAWAVEASIALSIYTTLDGRSAVASTAWPAVLAAVLAASAWQTTAVFGVISLHSLRLDAAVLLESAPPALACGVGGCALATLAHAAYSWSPLAVIPVAVTVLGLAMAGRAYARLRSRNTALKRLYEATRQLARSHAAEHVLADVLAVIADIMRAERAELLIIDNQDAAFVHALDADGTVTSRPADLPGKDHLFAVALDRRESVLARAGGRRRRSEPVSRVTWRDCVISPLPPEATTRGAVMVADRQGDVASFSRDDVSMLDALARQAASALDNALLLERLAFESRHDALTGLANRTAFYDVVGNRLAERQPGAVLLMDLDRFKEINDTLGHQYGDLLLVEVARRLEAATRTGDCLARLGGDQFAVHLAVGNARDAGAAAARLHHALAAPVTIDGFTLAIQASSGIAMAYEHGSTAATLLRRADQAMYSAKRSRTGVAVHNPEDDQTSLRQLALAAGLAHAIGSGQLELRYQPQLGAVSGAVEGVEALLRWQQHPELGLVPPDEFIALAEQTGHIQALTRWVIRTAARQASQWQRRGVVLNMSVNLSIRNLLEADLPAFIAQTLRTAGVQESTMTFEITESQLMADPRRILTALRDLRARGMRVSMDDFGTGYSSLAHLRVMPLDELKIDRSFVAALQEVDRDPERSAEHIVEAVVTLARSMGLTTVAEGVEDLPTAGLLARLGCDRLQGYAFSRPLLPDAFLAWLPRPVPTASQL